MRRVLKIAAFAALALLLLLLAGAAYLYMRVTQGVYGNASEQPSVLEYAEEPPPAAEAAVSAALFNFDPGQFREPNREYGPFTRWWWPGNDVTQAELKREIGMLAAAGFAGVEIQPFVMGLNSGAAEAERARVLSWDGEGYYSNLRAVMDAAIEAGMVVDLNNGSGWPTGGPQISIEDNFRTLLFTETTAAGGDTVRWEMAPPEPPLSAYVSLLMASLLGSRGAVHFPDQAKIEAVIGAKTVDDQRSWWSWSVTDQVRLDPQSSVDLTNQVEGNVLSWEAPEGDWRLIAFWSLPDGESPALLANKNPGFVVDHFDAAKVRANYDYLLGSRTGLAPYYGKPLRAVFNDSYEFKADRHYTSDFFDQFKRRRGYDVRPWLPANMQPGYNHILGHLLFPQAKPDFGYSEEDWRLRHDYDLTLSELLLENFLDTSAEWMSRRGLQHRTQAYGMPMDVIGASGRAQIPEAEQLFWGGSEAFLKAVSSGAHLYNRPVTTAESVVYRDRAGMTTPQKIKISVDKALTSGVNQVIYHGTAYHYETDDFGEEGWYPWNSPHASLLNFSSDLREVNPFWKYIADMNAYIARAQYALRSGRPSADVLIYYPFLGFAMGKEVVNPEELLPGGYFDGVEPPLAPLAIPFGPEPGTPERSVEALWFEQVWEAINILEAQGVTWDWVNDESLQAAAIEEGRWAIRGHRFEALVLPEIPFMPLPTASHIHELVSLGARAVVAGEAPRKQPGFRDYEALDHEVETLFKSIAGAAQTVVLTNANGLADWATTIEQPIRYAGHYRHLRQIRRVMADGSRVVFLRSKAAEWTDIRIDLDPAFREAYFLNPVDGAAYAVQGSQASYTLPPYGSIVLYAGMGRTAPPLALSPPIDRPQPGTSVTTLDRWDLRAAGAAGTAEAERADTTLFDWRADDAFRYSSTGVYHSAFDLAEIEDGARYLLDLGTVFFAADVVVNGSAAGSTIFAPHVIDLTEHLRPGQNTLEVRVTATQLNEFVGRAEAGNEHYRQFKGKGGDLMPAGLLGPVQIRSDSQ